MSKSNFERIGGTPVITAIIDSFYTKILESAITKATFNNSDVDRVKAKQVEFFSNALGSGTAYTGSSMLMVHTGLGITEEQYATTGKFLYDTLLEFSVPQDIRETIMQLLEFLKTDIVGH